MDRLQQRMYFFVPYNISDIQKGIQAGHSALEYVRNYGETEEYDNFIRYDKVWIILSGGTTLDYYNTAGGNIGTMNQIEEDLYQNRINFSVFREPDLNMALSSVCFLCDERVYDSEKYPEWDCGQWNTEIHLYIPRTYESWLEWIGGEKNLFLRNLIKNKRLA